MGRWPSRIPATIRVDQSTEFVSRDLDLWAHQRRVTLDFSRRGKLTRQCLGQRRDEELVLLADGRMQRPPTQGFGNQIPLSMEFEGKQN
jgi:hypothetical protein